MGMGGRSKSWFLFITSPKSRMNFWPVFNLWWVVGRLTDVFSSLNVLIKNAQSSIVDSEMLSDDESSNFHSFKILFMHFNLSHLKTGFYLDPPPPAKTRTLNCCPIEVENTELCWWSMSVWLKAIVSCYWCSLGDWVTLSWMAWASLAAILEVRKSLPADLGPLQIKAGGHYFTLLTSGYGTGLSCYFTRLF